MPTALDAAPIDVTVQDQGAPVLTLVSAPIDLTVEEKGGPALTVSPPPVDTTAGPRVPTEFTVRRWMLSPEHNAILPVSEPSFIVSVTLLAGNVTTTPVSLTLDFGNSGVPILSRQLDLILHKGENIITISADRVLSDGSYWWRAKLVVDGNPGDWIETRNFSIDTATAGAVSVPMEWTASAGIATGPYLWMLYPASAQPSDTIIIVGTGFPSTATVVTMGAENMPIESWTTAVAATPAAATPDRTISIDVVDCEHDEVTVTVPADAAVGGIITIDDGRS